METGFYPHLMPIGTLFLIVLEQIQLETAIENRWPQLPKGLLHAAIFFIHKLHRLHKFLPGSALLRT
jgi:hypothetical protein